MKLAIFDIDGTLIHGRSTERRFFAYLVRHRCIGGRQLVSFARNLYPLWIQHGRHAPKKNKAYLDGLDVDAIARLADKWLATLNEDAWCRPVVQQLQTHLSQGDRVVLLSGTLSVIADAIARSLGAHDSRGSEVATEDGRYRGSQLMSHPFGEDKRVIAQQLALEAGIAPQDTVAYADSSYDDHLLRWVGNPVAACPDRRLEDTARRNGWPVIS